MAKIVFLKPNEKPTKTGTNQLAKARRNRKIFFYFWLLQTIATIAYLTYIK